MTRDFSRLFKPRSIALIGAAAWCSGVIANLRAMGFVWDIWPVVPGESAVDGVRAFESIERLPAPPDVGFVCLDGAEAVTAVAALARRGAGAALCQGMADPAALAEAAGRMLLLGPGCHGFVSAMERAAIWEGPLGLRPVKRGVALLARSASLAQSLSMQRRGLPIACVAVAAPGPAQTGMARLGAALLQDDRITALGLQAEDLGDPEAFLALAQVAERLGKPVIVLRAGEEPGAAALIARAGMARVRSPEALLEALKILHVMGALPANALAALSCSTGTAQLVRDLAAAQGLRFPPFSEAQRRALADDLGPGVALENPLDCSAAVGRPAPRMARIFAEVMSGGAVLTLAVLDCPREDRCDDETWQRVAEAAAAARARVGMPLAMISTLPEGLPEARAEALMGQRLIPLAGLSAALEALAACVALGGPLRRPAPLFMPAQGAGAGLPAPDPAQAAATLAAQGLELLPPGTEPEGPALALHLSADAAYGYVLTFRMGATQVSGLLPLRREEARTLLSGLPLSEEDVAAVVPALLSVQDYVIAQKGTVAELELGFRPGSRGRALASGLRIRAAGG
ncbi:CoA-binding protein [Salipiger sp. P9]|uniref:CoA-binding protein n=1 Tax=Salipiger pentaromativorans TaxID=2943193 RepID=UPI0021580A5D|nr:CoA-binding protein [Salipiger pentaromativorans]MCR8547135.1 CoA-binding protein [Salipiger pentaromativorans]